MSRGGEERFGSRTRPEGRGSPPDAEDSKVFLPEDSIDLVAEDAPPKEEAPVPVAFLCVRCWKTFPSWSAAICPSCGTMRPVHGWATMPYTFRDRYLFWRPLGRGGMGAVFLAYDEHQTEGERRPVAVKVIPESHSERERVALRRFFEREAAAAAMLAQSPCFVRVTSHDVGVSPAYMAMEYVEWPTLRDLLRPAKTKTPRPLPPIRAAKLGIALLRGVSVMHFHRIVHRDLKPDNVFVARVADEDDYRIKILDLGVWTKDASDRSYSPTLIGPEAGHERAPVGTYSYMSPEQMEGRPVGCASDLHTVGSLLWELVTGRVPFPFDRRAPEPVALLDRRERLKLELKRPEAMPEDLFQILAKALAYDPDERWESAEDLRTALRVFVAEEAKHRAEVVRSTNQRLEDFLGHVEALRGKIRPASEVLVRADRIAETIARYRSVVVETEPHRLKSSLDSIEASIEQLDRSVSQLVGHLAGAEARPFATVDVPPAVTKDLREHAARAPSRRGLAAGALFLGIAIGLGGFALRAERPIPAAPASAIRREPPARVEPPPVVTLARGPLRLAVHPTEARAVAVGRDFSIVGFELAGGRIEASLPGEAAALDLALAPDGRRFALVGDDQAVRVYERGAARPSLVLRAIERPRAIVFAADGASLWVGDAEGRLHEVSPDSGRIARTIATEPRRGRRRAPAGAPVVALAALRRGDEAWIAAATGAAVFELGPSGGALHPTPGHARALAFTPRGDLWVGLDSGEVVRLGPTGEIVARARAHTGAVRDLSADRDGGVTSGGEDHQLAFVAEDGAIVRSLARPAPIAAVAYGADGRLVVGEEDGRLSIFGDPAAPPALEQGPSHGPLGGLALDPERGLVVALGFERPPVFARAEDGVPLGRLDGPPAAALARADDGALATVDLGGTIRIFAPGATAPTLAIASSIGEPRALGVSRSVVAVGGADGRLEVFARRSGQPLHRADTGRGAIEAIAVSAGEVIFGGEERALRRLELFARGEAAGELEPGRVSVLARAHDGVIRAIAVAPDGRFASAADDGRVRVWAPDGTLLRSAEAHDGSVRALAFSPDGARLASGGSDGRVREMVLGADVAVAEWSAHRGPVLGLAAVAGGWLSAGPDGFLVRSGTPAYRRRLDPPGRK